MGISVKPKRTSVYATLVPRVWNERDKTKDARTKPTKKQFKTLLTTRISFVIPKPLSWRVLPKIANTM